MRETPDASTLERFLSLTVPALPVAASLGLVITFGVDVPQQDCWDTPGDLLERWVLGEARWFDVIAHHNEHRPAVPRVIMALLAWAGGWHPKATMLLSWACAVATTALLVGRLPQRTTVERSMAAGLMAAFLLSAAQWKNLLWGTQIVMFLPGLCLAGMLAVGRRRGATPARMLGCGLLAAIATLSFGTGWLVWVLGWPGWPRLLARDRAARTVSPWLHAAYAVAGVVVTAGSAFGIQGAAASHAAPTLGQPDLVLRFLLPWLGAPMVGARGSVELASVVGTFVLGLLTMAALCFIRHGVREPGLRDSAWPGLAFAGYGLASGLLIAIGRAFLGMETALVPRYATMSLAVPAGAALAIAALARAPRSETPAWRGRLAPAALMALWLLALGSWVGGLERMPHYRDAMLQNRLTLRFVVALPDNPLLLRVHPRPDIVRQRIEVLASAGILPWTAEPAWLTQALRTPGVEALGDARIARAAASAVRVAGQARLPGRGRAADAVLVAIRPTPGVEPRPATLLVVRGGAAEARFADTLMLGPRVAARQLAFYAMDLEARSLHPLPQVMKASP